MGQIAYLAATGEMIEAFSVTDTVWDALCKLPRGSMTMPRTNWPATAKTSIKGLRFFSHYPGFPGGLPKPESYAHTRLKIDVVRLLRSMGFKANIEVPGVSPDGEEWIADVLAENCDGSRTAFEIQLSSQHLKDFRRRTGRYAASGVRTVWIISEQPVAERLTSALIHENGHKKANNGCFICDCEEILPLNVTLVDKDVYPEDPPLVRFGRGVENIRRMPLAEAINGAMSGFAKWEYPDWRWVNPMPVGA